MSGIEESKRLFIFRFDESVYGFEECIIGYRGVYACSIAEATGLAEKWCKEICEELGEEAVRLRRVFDACTGDKYNHFFINKLGVD